MADEKISTEKLLQLRNEIKMAEALNKEELEPICVDGLRRYVGNHVPAFGQNWDIVLNEVYPIVQANLPAIFFRNPRAFLHPKNKTFIARRRDPISGKMVDVQLDSSKSAKTQEYLLNYAMQEINYKKETRKVLLDALIFPHGIMWHGYKGDFGMTEEQSITIKNENVFVKRISPLKFLKDPCVNMSNIDEGRWVARIIDVPLQDILEDDRLDVDKNLKGFTGFGDRIGRIEDKLQQTGGDFLRASAYIRSLIDFTDKEYKNKVGARFVKVYEVFLRPSKKEARDGKKGQILLLTDEQQKPLRINSWSIKAEGFPSKALQFNELNDSHFGISDVSTYKSIADQKNIITNLQIRNAQEMTKTWVAIAKGGAGEEDIERVQRGDNSIVMFDGDTVQGKMSVTGAGGGASNELYLIDQRIQRNLEDKSGVTDLKRGYLQSGEESATSVKIRAAGGSARPMYRQDIMTDFLKDSMKYLVQLIKQFMPYKEAVRIVGSLDLEWSDNPTEEEIQAEVDVDIDAYSMLPEDPMQEMNNFMTVLNLMIQGLRDPIVSEKLRQEGKTVNLSPILEQILMRMKIRNPDIFRNIQPGETQGYCSVEQLKEGQANAVSALTGQPIPFPPKPTDDHQAKLEIYNTVNTLTQMAGQVSDALQQLIQVQGQLLQQKMDEEAKPGNQAKLTKPFSATT